MFDASLEMDLSMPDVVSFISSIRYQIESEIGQVDTAIFNMSLNQTAKDFLSINKYSIKADMFWMLDTISTNVSFYQKWKPLFGAVLHD